MKEKTINYRGYEVTQASNGHVCISQDGIGRMHVPYKEEKSVEELQSEVDDYIEFLENNDFTSLGKGWRING